MKFNRLIVPSLIITSALFAATSARAESYRFMNVEIRGAEGMNEVSKALGDPKTWPAFAKYTGNVTLKNIITVNIGADGTGTFDETYLLKYAQSVDAADQPKEFTTRKIGSQASVKKRADGTADIRLTITSLDRWIPLASSKSTLQPVFNTREMNSTTELPKDGSPIILGGLTREGLSADGKPEKVSTVLIVQRFEPVADAPTPPPTTDPFRAGK